MKRSLATRLAVLALITTAFFTDGLAQSKSARPLTAPDRVEVESTMSLSEFAQKRQTSSLLERMRARFGSPNSIPAGSRIIPTKPLRAKSMSTLSVGPARQSGVPTLDLSTKRAENGTVSWWQGNLGQADVAGKAWSAAAYELVARETFESYKGTLRLLNPQAELVSVRTELDKLGYTHTRFEQVYDGIPVWNSDIIAHFDPSGKLYVINGTYQPSPIGVATVPFISAASAKGLVINDLVRRQRWAPLRSDVAKFIGLEDPAPRLVIYPDEAAGPTLAYEVSIFSSLVESYMYLIEAQTGGILRRLSLHCTILTVVGEPMPLLSSDLRLPEMESSFSAEFTDAQGVDLNGQNTAMRVHLDDGGTFWLFSDLDNIGDFNLPNIPENGGAVTMSLNGNELTAEAQIAFVTSPDNSWADPSAVSAHANMKVVYDYFKNTFGRNAINGQDQSLISIIHAGKDGQPQDNASWNGRVMQYGDGKDIFKPLAGARDVAAHEMAHGVTGNSAGLVYEGQSGALNESFSDVFGVMNDRDDFLLGEDVMKTNHIALRSLKDPSSPQVFAGDPAVNGPNTQPGHMRDFRNLPNTPEGDNGGVHINSGIPNRAAALVIEAIGHDKTEQIYYRALTMYLTRNSQFGDARKALIQSATDLHPNSPTEAAAVAQAYDAVGITEGGGDTTDPTENDVPTVSGNLSLIVFVIADGSEAGVPDGSILFIDPFTQDPDGFLGIFSDPNAVARVGSQLTTTTDGTSIWFVNPDGRLAAIDLSQVDGSTPDGISAAPVIVGEGLFIQQAGDLWNASIGPIGFDETGGLVEIIALASAYENDPTLYFTDLEEITPVEIKPSTSAQGEENNLVQYPDVISWSPNPKSAKVAFDALNSLPAFGGGSDFWSVYELDFTTGSIFDLIPAQPADVSVGNITYSSTNPDIVAFNVISDDGTGTIVEDIFLANFESGQLLPLELPSLTDQQGNAILVDGDRPTFSPDDSFVGFSSVALNALVFYNTTDPNVDLEDKLQSISFAVSLAPFNPHWFVFRGDVGDIVATGTEDEVEIPTSAGLRGSYPNPFAQTSTIRFDLDEASAVVLEIYDALGRSVTRLVDGWMPAGRHEVRFEAGSLTPGTYLARLVTGDRTFVHKMLIVR